jgi:succinyl-CoA synthetase beta subunit
MLGNVCNDERSSGKNLVACGEQAQVQLPMNLHEYQAKALFRNQGIPIPVARLADSGATAAEAARALGGGRCLVKAQIHAGGRGKAGGVIDCPDPRAVEDAAQRLLGTALATAQSGGRALPVHQLLIETPSPIAREFYLAVLVERTTERILLLASRAGGGEVEASASAEPAAFERVLVHPAVGLRPWQCRHLGYRLGLPAAVLPAFADIAQGLYHLFITQDASLVEINPLALTPDHALIALDAKIVVDDNARFRHPDWDALRDPTQEDPREAEADRHGLSYVSLDGNIGCMVNGAGLAMATMDLVRHHGGAPANFLDVGGNTTAERVAAAFQLILSDTQVRAILVNIFGGIVRCDLIAEGLIQALADSMLRVPLVVRLAGTNAEQGLARLADSGLALQTASDLAEAANLVVAAASPTAG